MTKRKIGRKFKTVSLQKYNDKDAMRRNKILNVLVVDDDYGTRKELVNYYFKYIRPELLARYDHEQICNVSDIAGAQHQVVNGFDPDIVVFSRAFPERETDEFKIWLDSRQLATFFVLIGLPLMSGQIIVLNQGG